MASLSKGVRIRSGRGGGRAYLAKLNRADQLAKADASAFQEHLKAISSETRHLLLGQNADNDNIPIDDTPWGEEGEGFAHGDGGAVEDYSHNNGDTDDACETVFTELTHDRWDARTRHDRVHLQNLAWSRIYPALTTAYLAWKAGETRTGEGTGNFEVLGIDHHTHTVRQFTAFDDEDTNECLMRNGWIGCAPERPTVAFHIQLLESYRQLHRECPRLSIQAQVKALCHIHLVPYRRSMNSLFSMAFDVYLEILHRVDILVNEALGHQGPNWRMLNVCPPCTYELESEEPLKYKLQATMDGNSSLKLVAAKYRSGKIRQDERHSRKDMWITPAEVDVYKDEVKRKPRTHDANGNVICDSRLKAAGPDSKKKMFAIFEVTGIFACFCRHGHLLTMCDMIRTGEQMKYPLAIVAKLLKVFGQNLCLGYDIMCSFMSTLLNSCLAKAVLDSCLRGVVPGFHGYGHGRGCQTNWHPLHVEGAGKEDFEGSERAFSASNGHATGTRLATAFHRVQAIEQHWEFWSEEKYTQTANFIYNNYKQVIKILTDDTKALEAIQTTHKVTTAEIEKGIIDEREYLRNVRKEPDDLKPKIQYVQALYELNGIIAEYNQACRDVEAIQYMRNLQPNQVEQIHIRRSYTMSRAHMHLQQLDRQEKALGITTRWSPTSPEYGEVVKESRLRNYRLAVDKLEYLVVQRMFELTKLGMSGTGYKMRQRIGQALRVRSEAIKNALKEYNLQAAALRPPRPQLTWPRIVEMANLGEFDLLRDTREDIRNLPWTRPANREAANLYQNIKRAKEERQRLNIEISRLLTRMRDDHVDYQLSIRHSKGPLAAELSQRWKYRQHIDEVLVDRLVSTSQLSGFTGSLRVGHRIGRTQNPADVVPPSWMDLLRNGQRGLNEDHDDDWIDVEANKLVDFFDSIDEDE